MYEYTYYVKDDYKPSVYPNGFEIYENALTNPVEDVFWYWEYPVHFYYGDNLEWKFKIEPDYAMGKELEKQILNDLEQKFHDKILIVECKGIGLEENSQLEELSAKYKDLKKTISSKKRNKESLTDYEIRLARNYFS